MRRTTRRRALDLATILVATAVLASTSAQGMPSGEYGELPIGGSVEGTLAPVQGEELVGYHTYVLTIPPGSGPVTVTVEGFASDIDLALKLGSPILDFGDVDHLDVSEEPNPRHTLASPPAGPLYIDVLNLLPTPARYPLSVVAEASAAAPGAAARTPCKRRWVRDPPRRRLVAADPAWAAIPSMHACRAPPLRRIRTW